MLKNSKTAKGLISVLLLNIFVREDKRKTHFEREDKREKHFERENKRETYFKGTQRKTIFNNCSTGSTKLFLSWLYGHFCDRKNQNT